MSSRKTTISSTMNTPTIYYVGSESVTWAEYLKSKLAEEEYNIPTTLCDISKNVGELKNSTPNIVLVSPELADLDSWEDLRKLNPQQSIAVLLNINEDELTLLCTQHKDFPEILQWQVQQMESTDESVRYLLLTIIRLYENLDFEDTFDCTENPSPCGKRPVAIPVSESVHFDLDSEEDSGEIYETPPPPREKNDVYQIIQDKEDKQRVYILMDREADNNIDIIREGCPDGTTTADRIDKSIYHFKLPDKGNATHDGSFKFQVFSGSQNLGRGEVKCGSKLEVLRNILSEELSPITLLCQAMGTCRDDVESLDAAMAKTMKQWRPLRYLQHFEGPVSSIEGQTKWPTLLHFAAQYHLENFCRELLYFPGMVAACVTSNADGDYPDDIARKEGYEDLANELDTFVREYAASEQSKPQMKHDSGFGDVVPPPSRCLKSLSDSNYVRMDGKDNPPLPSRISAEVDNDDVYTTMSDLQHINKNPDVTGRHSMEWDSEKSNPSPCSSRPCSGYLSPSSIRSLSSSPVQNLLMPASLRNGLENSDIQTSHMKGLLDSSSTDDELQKLQSKKMIRRSSSGGLPGKISGFLYKIKRHRKQSVPDLANSVGNFQTGKAKFYTRQCEEEHSTSGIDSERDSGSFDGDDMPGSRPLSSGSLSRSSPVAIPVRTPRRPPSVKRQRSFRVNQVLHAQNVLAPPLPERRPLKHGNS